jgi:hypothetical protein
MAVVVGLAMLGSMAVGACGSKGSGGSAGSAGSVTTTSATSAALVLPPADKDRAKAAAALLTQADVGPGFKPVPQDNTPGNPNVEDKAFTACAQGNPVLLSSDTSREAASEFDRGDLDSVASDIQYVTSTAVASSAIAMMNTFDTQECLADAFRKGVEAEADTGGVTIPPVRPASVHLNAPADQNAGIRMPMTLTIGHTSLSFIVDIVLLRKGRAVAALMVARQNTPASQADLDRWATAITSRLQPT